MDVLRQKYAYLIVNKNMEINRYTVFTYTQHEAPTKNVFRWFENGITVEDKVDHTEDNSYECFFNWSPFGKFFVIEVTKEEDQPTRMIPFLDGLVSFNKLVSSNKIVSPDRSQLLDTIWEKLMDHSVGIIGIIGIGGVGKTTTMVKISNQLAKSDIFDTIIWVTVSKNLNLRKVQSDIALQMNLDLGMYDDVKHRADRLLESLTNINHFLIIFDDLWQDIPLKTIGIPQPDGQKNGCKIVLTTRKWQICHNMNSDKIIRVEVLSEKEGWDLFVTKAGNVVLNPEIQPLAKRVMQKCCGVPIITISVGLAMKDEASVEVWRKALEELSTPKHEDYDFVLEFLRFSYNRLRNDEVQKCFLYCAMFPEGCLFKPEELIRYWMTEGFVDEYGDIVREIDNGYKILSELRDSNMLEIFTKNGDEWFKMHGLFRDLAVKIMKEENGFLVRAGLGLQELPFWEWAPEAIKVSFIRNQIGRLDVVPFNRPNVSTLLLAGNPITHILSSFFSRISALKVLDISYSWIKELPTSLSELAQLRVLFLHYCRSLQKLPSLEKLKQLKVLSLCGTSITELPHGMEGLSSLRSLDLSETTKLENIPVGMISSLSRLEELRMQGSGLCKMDSPIVANYLMEMRSLKRLAILTLSTVGYGDHLEAIMCLQEQNLKIFSVNVYGSVEDYIEEVETE